MGEGREIGEGTGGRAEARVSDTSDGMVWAGGGGGAKAGEERC